jgi:hypothetical protein
MPRNSAPHMYWVDAGRKDQGRALLDGGSAPPPFNKDGATATGTTAVVNIEDKATCRALGI